MQHNNFHTIKFILILTVIVSFLLSITSTQLSELQDENVEIDKKKNILKVIGINVSNMTSESILNVYQKSVKEIILNENGELIDSLLIENLIFSSAS